MVALSSATPASPGPGVRRRGSPLSCAVPALHDTAIWLGLIVAFGALGIATWGTWWVVPVLAVYGMLNGGTSDAVYRLEGDAYYATDDLCIHEQAHLADGFVTVLVQWWPASLQPTR